MTLAGKLSLKISRSVAKVRFLISIPFVCLSTFSYFVLTTCIYCHVCNAFVCVCIVCVCECVFVCFVA